MIAYQNSRKKGKEDKATMMRPLLEPKKAFAENAGYFMEEKFWNLVMNFEASENSFNLMNFNHIVK
jgi:hypothetical protein